MRIQAHDTTTGTYYFSFKLFEYHVLSNSQLDLDEGDKLEGFEIILNSSRSIVYEGDANYTYEGLSGRTGIQLSLTLVVTLLEVQVQ